MASNYTKRDPLFLGIALPRKNSRTGTVLPSFNFTLHSSSRPSVHYIGVSHGSRAWCLVAAIIQVQFLGQAMLECCRFARHPVCKSFICSICVTSPADGLINHTLSANQIRKNAAPSPVWEAQFAVSARSSLEFDIALEAPCCGPPDLEWVPPSIPQSLKFPFMRCLTNGKMHRVLKEMPNGAHVTCVFLVPQAWMNWLKFRSSWSFCAFSWAAKSNQMSYEVLDISNACIGIYQPSSLGFALLLNSHSSWINALTKCSQKWCTDVPLGRIHISLSVILSHSMYLVTYASGEIVWILVVQMKEIPLYSEWTSSLYYIMSLGNNNGLWFELTKHFFISLVLVPKSCFIVCMCALVFVTVFYRHSSEQKHDIFIAIPDKVQHRKTNTSVMHVFVLE